MLAGIMQIRSPSGSNGWHIPKINPDMKKQPALLQAAYGEIYSNYYTLDYYNLKYNLSFLRLAFTVSDGDAQRHAEVIIVVLTAGWGLDGYFIFIGKECHQCLCHISTRLIIIQAEGDLFDIRIL